MKRHGAPLASGFLREHFTEYIPKKNGVKQPPFMRPVSCKPFQSLQRCHNELPIRHGGVFAISYREEP
jgi:hypothetical protein